jgi:hypothetical protein
MTKQAEDLLGKNVSEVGPFGPPNRNAAVPIVGNSLIPDRTQKS